MTVRTQTPFPLEIIDLPQVKRLRAIAYGIFFRLVTDYWITGLPIPTLDCDVVALANCDMATIQRYKPLVEECLVLVLPELNRRRDYALKELHRQQATAEYARSVRDSKKRLRESAKKNLRDEIDTHLPVSPIEAPQNSFRDSFMDQRMRLSAIKSNKKSTGKLLTDK